MNNTGKENVENSFNYLKFSILTIAVTTIAWCCIYFYISSLKNYTIYPGFNNFYYAFYNDSLNGGNSRINHAEVSDSIVSLDFELKKGFLSPYVGMTLSPKSNTPIDLSRYNQLSIGISGENISNIAVSIFTQKPQNQAEINSSEMCFHTNVAISAEKKSYTIPLKQFKLPDWWRDLHNIPSGKEIAPDYSQILHINIGTAYTPNLEAQHKLKIYQISFSRDNSQMAILFLIIEVALILVLGAIYFIRKTGSAQNEPLTITYKPVEISDEPVIMTSFLDFINQNFQNSELSLEQVADNTGVSTRKITSSIQEQFGCNFKTYINQIRINEAKRMLTETELTIGDIAFKVGFSNQSHFNRVFKSITESSPSQFRQQK